MQHFHLSRWSFVLALATGCGSAPGLEPESHSALIRLSIALPAGRLLQGDSVALVAYGHRQNGDSLVIAGTWTAAGGSVSADGWYRSADEGRHLIRCVAPNQPALADTASVEVVSPLELANVTVTPAAATVRHGRTLQFRVQATLPDQTVIEPEVEWRATGGSIDSTGRLTGSGSPGEYQVTATIKGRSAAGAARLTLLPAVLDLVISPDPATVDAGESRQFDLTAAWSDGSTAPPPVSWTATGGTISAAGRYTAGASAGTYWVIAASAEEERADTAAVSITPSLVRIDLAPGDITLGRNDTTRFAVNGIWTDGSINQLPATYAVTGGNVTSEGRYTAPPDPGSYRLIATHAGRFADTATIIVPTLRSLASPRGFAIGAAVRMTALKTDSLYRRVLASEYNAVTAENAMKFEAIHPARFSFAFADADLIVEFARENQMAVHGHTLVWHMALPAWLTTGNFTKAQLLTVLRDHIMTIGVRYRGRVGSWDVVNEVVDPQAPGGLRQSIWLTTIGPEYIDSAFVWARRADPAAKLYLNETHAEGMGAKADIVSALVSGLQARRVPIDGVGFQSHFTTSPPAAGSIRANLARFAARGLELRVTELDVEIPDTGGPAVLAAQAAVYRDVLGECLRQPRCVGLTTWGFTDRYSWIPQYHPGFGRALPFDTLLQPKPAYRAMFDLLRIP